MKINTERHHKWVTVGVENKFNGDVMQVPLHGSLKRSSEEAAIYKVLEYVEQLQKELAEAKEEIKELGDAVRAKSRIIARISF